MEIILLATIAFFASILTFFSGFGLGTILTPVFMISFPPSEAIAMSSIVHLANNLFKISLMGKKTDMSVLFYFGIPSVGGAAIGAYFLWKLRHLEPLFYYSIGNYMFEIEIINLLIALLLFFFTLTEIYPIMIQIPASKKWLPGGGLVSGFFGGLSGHQGALRTAFLIKTGLPKESFIATAIAISTLLDITRLGIYAVNWESLHWNSNGLVLLAPILAAMAGAYLGMRLLRKITMQWIQRTVTVLLLIFAIALGMGWI